MNNIAPPPDFKPTKGLLWCPVCGKEVKFKNNAFVGVNQCPECHVSDRDFDVKKYNGLWEGGSFGVKRKNEGK